MKLKQRSGFAVQHLEAAARCSFRCGKIQQDNLGKPLGSFYEEQIACTSATVMLCVASLESNINEYFADPYKLFSELTLGQADEFVELISKLPILEKYDRTLSIKACQPFCRGLQPYQDVKVLINLRNELVHFHPEWHDEQERHAKIGRQLIGKFEFSPFIVEDEGVIFPQRIVSHGCTKWAVTTVLEFAAQFEDKIGVRPKFSGVLSKFSL